MDLPPWRELIPLLSDMIPRLLQARDAAEAIAEQLDAARCIELALSAVLDPTWPSSYVAAAAAKLLAGATEERLPPLVKLSQLVLNIVVSRMSTGPQGLLYGEILRYILRYLRDTKPSYDEIPMGYFGPDAYDSICGHLEPIRKRIALAVKEIGVADWHYHCVHHYLEEAPYEAGMIAEAKRHATLAYGCIENAYVYIDTIVGVLNQETHEVQAFFNP